MLGEISKSYGLPNYFLALLFMATPLMAISYYFFPSFSQVLYAKDILVVCFSAYVFLKFRSEITKPSTLYFVIPFLILLAGAFVVSDAALKAKLASSRQLFYPLLFVGLGYLVGAKIVIERLEKFIVTSGMVLVFIGGFMIFLGGSSFLWIRPYFLSKGLMLEMSGYPSQWVEPVFGGIPRMASTFFDPVNFGHFLVLALVVAFVRKAKWWVYLILLTGLVSTICKGAWLQFILFVGLCIIPFPKWLKAFGLLLLPFVVIGFAQIHPGVALHLKGIVEAFETISWFGYGLAETGNVAIIFGNPTGPEIHDTYIGAVIGQIGVVGLLFWLMPFIIMFSKVNGRNKALAVLIALQFLVAVYSENTLNLLSIAAAFLLLGTYLRSPISRDKTSEIGLIDHVGHKAGMDYFSGQLADAIANKSQKITVYSNFKGFGQANYIQCFSGKRENIWQKATDFYFGHFKAFGKALSKGQEVLIFHSFETGKKEFSELLLAKMLGFKVHIILHDVEGFAASDSKTLKRVIFHHLADIIYSLNKTSRQILLQNLGTELEPKIRDIKHGNFVSLVSNSPTKSAAKAQLNWSESQTHFLFFGQIKPVKGLDVLLHAFEKMEGAQLHIAGKVWQDNFEDYQTIIDEKGLANKLDLQIRFIPDEERDLMLNAADAIVLPYKKIFQSGVLLMAMSYAKPVIVSNLPSNLEVAKHGENALVFQTENIQDLFEKLAWVVQNPLKLEDLGKNALQTVIEEYSWEQSAAVIVANCNQELSTNYNAVKI